MAFLYIKSLHIIFVVTWFAGLFYIVRLFVYFVETDKMEEPTRSILRTQYKLMQRRLWYGITWPSAIITLILGSTLIFQYGFIPDWLWLKLIFVSGLYAYHFYCHKIFKQHQIGIIGLNSNQLRIFNEVATLFLFAIVFLVILKNSYSWIYGIVGLAILATVLMAGIYVYKKLRN
jgi:protoporphyrinogen IX oxidase